MEQNLEQKMTSLAMRWGGIGVVFGLGAGLYELSKLGESRTTGITSFGQFASELGSTVGFHMIGQGVCGALIGATVAVGTYYAVKAYRSLTEK